MYYIKTGELNVISQSSLQLARLHYFCTNSELQKGVHEGTPKQSFQADSEMIQWCSPKFQKQLSNEPSFDNKLTLVHNKSSSVETP